ncbi:MAG: hypothetical protein Q7V57_03275 [Actinomycetota bacterium]|nr:hypothetical protein [Actinomycetota bacterium]
MPLTVADLRKYLEHCEGDEHVVIAATLSDGTALGVEEVTLGFDQGGPTGDGIEVVISWERGAEITTSP